MIRVALAEEQRILRWALGQALAKTGEIEIVGEAGDATTALAMVKDVKPDVLVLNTALRDHTGFDLLAQIRDLESGPFLVVVAAYSDPPYAARAIAAGAHAFVSMADAPDKLVHAIRAVTQGEQIIPPGVDKLLALGDGHPASSLTARELQVMEMLARGMTNREIAEHLEIRVKTVDTHRSHVLKKLGLRNNSDLTRFAVKHGYVSA